ncbi:MAG: tetratricopeptide repeat protein [Prochlorococcaceae cyanobacterium]
MKNIPRQNNCVLQRLNDGTLVATADTLNEVTSYVLQEQGDWFEDEIKFLRNLAQPGQIIVDIGAQHGLYSLPLAHRVGPSGLVWAFEEDDDIRSLLAQGVDANGITWARLSPYKMSDTVCAAPHQPEQHREGEDVPVITLDACLEIFGWQQVDLLRISSGGEAERVLSGGKQFFRQLSPLVMFRLRTGAQLHLHLVQQFEAIGYRCFRLVPGLGVLNPFDIEEGVDGFLINLFAAREDRVAALAQDGLLIPTANSTSPDRSRLEPYDWHNTLVQLPYGRAMLEAWAAAQPFEDHDTNSLALALWAFSQDPSQPITERLSALKRSYRLLCQLCRPGCPASRWSSLVRVAHTLGERLHAVRAVGHLLPLLQETQAVDQPEPFLAPTPSHDAINPQDRAAAWLEAAAWEADELIASFSGFYTGADAMPRLQRIETLGFASSAAQRRLQLVRSRFPLPPPASPAMEHVQPDQISRSRQAWEYVEKGQWDKAKTALDEARSMGDCCSEALYYIGKCLFKLGESHEAMGLLQRAVELAPENPTYLLDLGVHLIDLGQVKAGEAVVQQAVFLYGFLAASGELTANDLANLGIAYSDLGETENALASLERALALEPKRVNARRRKAWILHKTPDRRGEALEIWQELLTEDPKDVTIILCIEGVMLENGELQSARDLIDQALKLAPEHLFTYMKMAWLTSISGKPAMADHLRYLQQYWTLVKELWPEGGSSEPVIYAIPALTDKVRVGILSAEVGDHVVGLFLEPFLRHYDRSRLEVELIQTREISSGFADFLRAQGDAVLSVEHLDIPEARRRVRSRGYHVIVETSGFTMNTGIPILANRCAPVQCHYIGFHASTGLETIDWFIGDELTAAADLQDQYVERLWRLPRPWLTCRLDPNLPEATSVLEDEPPVLGSFNQFGKVREETLAYWAAALRRVPQATLQLKSFTGGSDAPLHRVRKGLSTAGVDPDRVVFLPRSPSTRDSLERYRGIDVALDTTPWSGATTCFDALSMGVPVVAIRGDATASRMSSSIVRGIGREDWVARSPEGFAEVVADLVADLPRLRAGRQGLRRQVLASRLFDGADLACHLQEALLSMARACTAAREPSQASLS